MSDTNSNTSLHSSTSSNGSDDEPETKRVRFQEKENKSGESSSVPEPVSIPPTFQSAHEDSSEQSASSGSSNSPCKNQQPCQPSMCSVSRIDPYDNHVESQPSTSSGITGDAKQKRRRHRRKSSAEPSTKAVTTTKKQRKPRKSRKKTPVLSETESEADPLPVPASSALSSTNTSSIDSSQPSTSSGIAGEAPPKKRRHRRKAESSESTPKKRTRRCRNNGRTESPGNSSVTEEDTAQSGRNGLELDHNSSGNIDAMGEAKHFRQINSFFERYNNRPISASGQEACTSDPIPEHTNEPSSSNTENNSSPITETHPDLESTCAVPDPETPTESDFRTRFNERNGSSESNEPGTSGGSDFRDRFNQRNQRVIPLRHASELIVGQLYVIFNVQRVNTRFGTAIRAEISDDRSPVSRSFLFLPSRFRDTSDDDIRAINEAAQQGRVYLVYRGRIDLNNYIDEIVISFI